MRVVVLSHSSAVENLGGAERSMLALFDDIQRERPEIEFAVVAREPAGLLQPELGRRGIPCLTLPFNSWVLPKRITQPEDVFRTSREDFVAIRAIAQFLEEWRPDVVWTNTIVSPWAAIAAALVGVPHIWFPREFGDDHEFQHPQADVFGDLGLMSDRVVTNSEALRHYLQRWIPGEKMVVLYPALALDDMEQKATVGSNELSLPFSSAADLRVVCVARVAQTKGQHHLIPALASLRDRGIRVEVCLVGGASAEVAADLWATAEQFGVARQMSFVGEQENPFPYIAGADVGVVLSRSEGFGRATVEYMALGKPVVAFDVGANSELVTDGVTGALVHAEDSAALADALESYARDSNLLAAHSRAAHEFAHTDLGLRHPLEAFLSELDSIVELGRIGMPRLPAIMSSWFDLPRVSLEYLTESGATRDFKAELPWRVGAKLGAVVRRLPGLGALRAVIRR